MAKAKCDRQKEQNRERVRRYRAKLSAEKLEEKRKYDRARYEKLKKENKVKPISEMTAQEQRKVRQKWKKQNERKKERRAQLKALDKNTPPPCPQPGTSQDATTSQKKRGRKEVSKDRAKAYRTIKKQKEHIEKLERKLRELKKRMESDKKKTVGSPSPRKLVKQMVRPTKVSPAVKKQLFLGFALQKQLECQTKEANKSKVKIPVIRRVSRNKQY